MRGNDAIEQHSLANHVLRNKLVRPPRIYYLTTERPFIARFLMLIGAVLGLTLGDKLGHRILDQNTPTVDEAKRRPHFLAGHYGIGMPNATIWASPFGPAKSTSGSCLERPCT